MKLADLRPCDACGGPLFVPATGRTFWLFRVSAAAVTDHGVALLEAAARTYTAIDRIEGRYPRGESVVDLGDAVPALRQEAAICSSCLRTVTQALGLREPPAIQALAEGQHPA